jgi:Fe-S oxidoreductase
MLTPIEKILFGLAVVVSMSWSFVTFRRMFRAVMRGQGTLNLDDLPKRLSAGIVALVTQGRMIRRRPLVSFVHCFVAWGFLFYLLVNVTDLLEGYLPGFHLRHDGLIWGLYSLLIDLFSVAALFGISFFLARRFVVRSSELTYSANVKLHPDVLSGLSRDSLIVGVFILGHVGFRFLGASIGIAQDGGDTWQPIAGFVAGLWREASVTELAWARHICWWGALGLILGFLPYFPYSKHAHLFLGPINWMTRPGRRSPGALDVIDFEDESLEQFGAATLTDLSRTQILDGFACIACNRCQDACPAYLTGKELSPSALEVNKRAYLKENLKGLSTGEEESPPLLGYAISDSAVWGCLSCGACTEACPVGNEPMRDILDIRRDQVLMNGQFPDALRGAYTGMERNGNPWQMTEDRLVWTRSLDFSVPTVEQNPDFDLLYWVGCAGAFDPTAQKVAQAIATLLHNTKTNFAVLGNDESCTGDLARRSGNEHLFYELARGNIETLNAAGTDRKRILTGCPHCMHTLGNEYPDLGGNYEVVHHTQFISEAIDKGQLKPREGDAPTTTFHDPCYLGRQNGEYEAPRRALTEGGRSVQEMGRAKSNSFCCGGGGAQMWKEEEEGTKAVSDARFQEASETGAETLAVGCPFCARMLGDANARAGTTMEVKDVAEIAVESFVAK